jgi:hypothetical protein
MFSENFKTRYLRHIHFPSMNMKKYMLFAAASIILTAGCEKKKEEPLSYSNDNEQSLGWVNQQTIRQVPKAHSGSSVSLMDSVQIYSITLRESLSKIKQWGAAKLMAKAWVNLSGPDSHGGLVISIDGNGKNYLWQSVPFESFAKTPGQWAEVIAKVKLDPKLPDDALLSVFGWNTSKTQIMVDDLQVSFEK